MAIAWGFSLALRFGPPAALYAYRTVSRGQPSDAQVLMQWIRSNGHWDPIGQMSDAELSALISADVGYAVNVATWETEVDLRKLQVRYSRAPAGGTVEDVAVTTHTFLKAPGGVADGVWTDPGNYASVETAFSAMWTSIKGSWPTWCVLDQYRWYVDNSAMRLPDHAPNPAVRVTEVDVPGTGSGNAMPPQVALSVTEITAARKSWGRFYLPSPTVSLADASGRSAGGTTVQNAVVAFYNACRSAGLIPVVFAPGLPERSSAAAVRAARAVGPTEAAALDIPARTSVIYEVTSIQMDNLFDVIRSRRWDAPSSRLKTALT